MTTYTLLSCNLTLCVVFFLSSCKNNTFIYSSETTDSSQSYFVSDTSVSIDRLSGRWELIYIIEAWTRDTLFAEQFNGWSDLVICSNSKKLFLLDGENIVQTFVYEQVKSERKLNFLGEYEIISGSLETHSFSFLSSQVVIYGGSEDSRVYYFKSLNAQDLLCN